MKFNLIIYLLNLVIVLNLIAHVHCMKRPRRYVEYAINVLDHMRPQIRHNISMRHITLTKPSGSRISTYNLFPENGDEYNFREVLTNLSRLLNFRYMEIIQTFNVLLISILQKCECESNRPFHTSFIELTFQVLTAVKNSAIVFSKLLNVTEFLSHLVQTTDIYYPNQLFPVENYMTFVKNRVNLIVKSYLITDEMEDNHKIIMAVQLFDDLKGFQINLQEISEKFYDNKNFRSAINFDIIPSNFISFYNTELIQNIEESNFLFQFEMINAFFQMIVECDYEENGFERIIYPISPTLMSPTDTLTKKERYAVSLYSRICSRNGWDLLNHISIKNQDEWMNVEQVIRNEVDISNVEKIYQNILMLLKCRYMEILTNFKDIFNTLTDVCLKEMGKNSSSDEFVDCVKTIYTSFNKSSIMLNCMYFAIETIRESRPINHLRSSNVSSIEKLLKFLIKYISNTKENLFLETMNVKVLSYAAEKYFFDYYNMITNVMVKHIYKMQIHHVSFCVIRGTDFDKNVVLASYHNAQVNEFFNSYYETVLTNDFKNLGFSLEML